MSDPILAEEQVTALEQRLTGALREEAKAIQTNLDEKWASGMTPADERVKDLEKRQLELEERIREKEEEVRLIRAEAAAIPRERDPGSLWRGVFFKDLDAARQTVRAMAMQGYSGREARAIDLAVLSSGGGALEPETADAFIDTLVEQQVALSRVTTRRMMSNQGHIDELRVAARKMIAATEATAPAVADAVTTNRHTLTTTEAIWAEDITLSFLEDNIERANAEQHIARLLATQFGNDLNDLAWNGDGSTAPFLSINTGWFDIAGADGDVTDYDATSDTTVKAMLHGALRDLPTKFLGRTDFVYFVSTGTAQIYAEEVSARETGLGDSVLVNGFPALRYFGRPVLADPHITGTDAMLTAASNLVFGIQRQINIDAEWVPRKRIVEYTVTARFDYEYATGEAVVLIENVPAALR